MLGWQLMGLGFHPRWPPGSTGLVLNSSFDHLWPNYCVALMFQERMEVFQGVTQGLLDVDDVINARTPIVVPKWVSNWFPPPKLE